MCQLQFPLDTITLKINHISMGIAKWKYIDQQLLHYTIMVCPQTLVGQSVKLKSITFPHSNSAYTNLW